LLLGELTRADRRAPETDVATIERLASSAKTPAERARLEGLAQRLQSGDEHVRQAAGRETHAVKALHAHPSLKDSGRTASDSRMKHRTAPSSKEAGGMQPLNAAGVSSPSLAHGRHGGSGNDNNAPPSGPLKRLSFWQRRRGSVVVTGPKGEAGVASALPPDWDDSWEVPCDVLGSADWDTPHPPTDKHSLITVKTKKFCVALGGPSTAALPDGLLLEDWES
jgi:hypothetical protein